MNKLDTTLPRVRPQREEPLAPGIVFVRVHAWLCTDRGYRCQWCKTHTTRPVLAGCPGQAKGGQ